MGIAKVDMTENEDTDVVVMKMPTESVEYTTKLFSKMTKTLLLNPARFHVLDFENVNAFPWQLIPIIESYEKTLDLNEKHLAFLNLSENILDGLKSLNLEDKFSCIQSVAELDNSVIYEKLNIKKRNLKKIVNHLFLNAFIEATSHTFAVQAKTPVRALKPVQEPAQAIPLFPTEVVSKLMINSDKFSGQLLLQFTDQRFLKVYNKMLGESNKDITQDIAQGSRELLNIIYGCAKQSLAEIGHAVEPRIEIPTHLNFDEIIDIAEMENQSVVIPFQSRAGVFSLEIIVEEFFLDEH